MKPSRAPLRDLRTELLITLVAAAGALAWGLLMVVLVAGGIGDDVARADDGYLLAPGSLGPP